MITLITLMSRQVALSYGRMQAEQVDLLYLHAPDHTVPIEDTLAGIHLLHQQGMSTYIRIHTYL